MSDIFKEFESNLFPSLSKLVFLDNDKEREWEEMSEPFKKQTMHLLKETCSKMENKIAIELLCHVINDLGKRISELENKKDE